MGRSVSERVRNSDVLVILLVNFAVPLTQLTDFFNHTVQKAAADTGPGVQ